MLNELAEKALVPDELKAQFTLWLKVIAQRAKSDYLRQRKRFSREMSFNEIKETENSYELGYLEQTEFLFEDPELAKAFQKLSASQQQVLSLRIAKGCSLSEVSQIMGNSSAQVSRLHYKALTKLRDNLSLRKTHDE